MQTNDGQKNRAFVKIQQRYIDTDSLKGRDDMWSLQKNNEGRAAMRN